MKKFYKAVGDFFNLVFRSLELDLLLLLIPMSLHKKVVFIIKKYWILCWNYVFGFIVGESFCKIFGSKFFYDDIFGIAFLESVYVDNAFLSHFIKNDSIVIDVGANVGQFNFFAKHYLKTKRIYSFEPIKKSFELLKKNSSDTNFQKAVSLEKELMFYVPVCTSLMASSFVNKDDEYKQEIVSGIKLDDVLEIKKESCIDLLKIDTEGSELSVLETSKNTLQKTHYLLVELSINRSSSGLFMDSIYFLKKNIPTFEIVHLGRQYSDKRGIIALDVLFENKSFIKC